MTAVDGYRYRPEAGARDAFDVYINGNGSFILVDNTRVAQLGFTPEQVSNAQREFAETLYTLSQTIATNQPNDIHDSAALEASLRPEPPAGLDCLRGLRKLGAGLRADLSKEMVDALKVVGFLRGRDSVDEPALTFVEDSAVPTPWEMLYEGPQAETPDWRKFWGFRVPITHWTGRSRTAEIILRDGLFSAIYEGLRFAGKEVETIAEKLELSVPHRSLGEAFRDFLEQALADAPEPDRGQLESWWHACRGSPETWLSDFPDTSIGTDNAGQRDAGAAEEWKQQALAHIFLHPDFRYGLIHFACHCNPSTRTQFLSRLDMKIAGEPVSLEVAFIGSDLRRKERWNREDPGPLVFLNACGTGEQSAIFEPPGFPDKWIDCQGALAVLATLCPVPDYFAHAFALKFYEVLFSGLVNQEAVRERFVAEALLETRRYFMEVHGNPLGLAYVLYATRGARVVQSGWEARP